MADNTLIIAVISAVGSGGLIGGLAAFVKVRPEAGSILVKTAQDVVVIQQGAMTEMQRRITSVETERDAVKARLANVEAERNDMRQRLARVEGERDDMRRRVAELEASVAALQRQSENPADG